MPESKNAEFIASDTPTPASIGSQIHSAPLDDLRRVAADPALTEDLVLALLKRTDLPPEVLEQLAKNAMRSSRAK